MKTLRVSLLAMLAIMPAMHGVALELGDNITLKPVMQNLYNVSSCMEIKKNFVTQVCCKKATLGGGCAVPATRGEFEYWEPAAIVEVSCRSGFSHLLPGIAPRDGGVQSCRVGPNWFFEAHVWASSGKANGDRSASLGYSFRENTMRCQADPTTGAGKYLNGYGIKHKGITFNSAGPGRSSKAYISEEDPNWVVQQGSAAQPQACDPRNPNIQACWGNPNIASGWVTHPNQAVAAGLAGYRALNKAMAMKKVVTPREEGWRMSMDYPFIMKASPKAQSMGLPDYTGRHMGSACFTPGNPGPFWYTAGGKNEMPNQMRLTVGQSGAAAHIPDGVYIFTYWVKTSCVVYDKWFPPRCMDDYKS